MLKIKKFLTNPNEAPYCYFEMWLGKNVRKENIFLQIFETLDTGIGVILAEMKMCTQVFYLDEHQIK